MIFSSIDFFIFFALVLAVLSLLTTAGSLAGGFMADRLNRWRALLGLALVMSVWAAAAAASPRSPAVFLVAVPVYLVLSGGANAAYTALLLEIGAGRRAASAQYTWLNNLGNLPVAYMTWLDGQSHRFWGAPGVFAVDGLFSAVPILLLFWLVARTGVDKETGAAVTAP